METNTNNWWFHHESTAVLLQEAISADYKYRHAYVHMPEIAKKFIESKNPDAEVKSLVESIKLWSADVLHYFLDESSTQVKLNPHVALALREVNKDTKRVLH